jgi:hypothetical protein
VSAACTWPRNVTAFKMLSRGATADEDSIANRVTWTLTCAVTNNWSLCHSGTVRMAVTTGQNVSSVFAIRCLVTVSNVGHSPTSGCHLSASHLSQMHLKYSLVMWPLIGRTGYVCSIIAWSPLRVSMSTECSLGGPCATSCVRSA